MARVAFVEVRDKTKLFAEVASRLTEHSVFWLIQNHSFANSSMSNVTVMPYPKSQDLRAENWLPHQNHELLERVAEHDRFPLYFSGSTSHYSYYYEQICAWFETVQPDVIFGEVGNFHSHIVALLAKEHGVPFLNPVSCRYPKGRFSFYLYDQLESVGGDSSDISESEIQRTVEEIQHGSVKPDYMSVSTPASQKLRYKAQITGEWIRGERFASQSPFSFFKRSRALKKLEAAWQEIAEAKSRSSNETNFTVLYPLQMQPELNLDIWGSKYKDQATLIQKVASSGATVYVKANPKSFHELNPNLIAALSEPNIIPLPFHVSMMTIEPKVDLVVTVSGTIAIERLVRQRPVMILSDEYASWLATDSASQLDVHVEEISRCNIEKIKSSQQQNSPYAIISHIAHQSYSGIIGEPLNAPYVLHESNITKLVTSFNRFIESEIVH